MSEKYEVYSGYVVAKGNDPSDVLCVCITEEDADAIVDAMNTKDEVETLREKLQQVEKILGVGHAKRTATTQEAVKTDPPCPQEENLQAEEVRGRIVRKDVHAEIGKPNCVRRVQGGRKEADRPCQARRRTASRNRQTPFRRGSDGHAAGRAQEVGGALEPRRAQ